MISTTIILLFLSSYSSVLCILDQSKGQCLNSRYSEFHVHGRSREAFLISIRSGARTQYGYSDDDIQDEELIEIDEEETISDSKSVHTTETVGVQFMITNKMRRVLESQLGYLPDEVDEMDPQIAAVVIDRVLSRPSKGMPDSWKRNASLEDTNDENRNYRSDSNADENSSERSNKVAIKRPSLWSGIRNQLTNFKDASLRFGSSRILPIIPALCIGIGMYGMVLVTPTVFRLLSTAATSFSQSTLEKISQWFEADDSQEEKPIPTIKPTITKSPDLKNKKVIPVKTNPIKNDVKKEGNIAQPTTNKFNPTNNNKIPIIINKKEKISNTVVKGVDLEGLAYAQHLSLWEVIRFRTEMIRRSFY